MNCAFSKIWVVVIILILIAGGIFAWQYTVILKKPCSELNLTLCKLNPKCGIFISAVPGLVVGKSCISIKEEEKVMGPERVETLGDETADWKTYRNEEYGFEIKYPLNWSVKEYWPGFIGFINPVGHISKIVDYEISIEIIELLGISFREFLTEKVKEGVYYQEKEIEVGMDNYKGIMVQAEYFDKKIIEEFEIVLLPRNSIVYKMDVKKNALSRLIFNQMLSTFRFLE